MALHPCIQTSLRGGRPVKKKKEKKSIELEGGKNAGLTEELECREGCGFGLNTLYTRMKFSNSIKFV